MYSVPVRVEEETRDTERGSRGGSGQAELWNGSGGRGWVEAQELLDGLFRPFEEMLAEEAAARPGARVLDVGCGTGATTLAAARRLGERGACTGVDVSEQLVAVARERAERAGSSARFELGDAQTHEFKEAAFDLLVSRFGVMFFSDPVAAFANLRRAAADGARMRFVAWRSPKENPFMTAAERGAEPLLDLPPRQPGGPGQFAFGDGDRVREILAASGWADAEVRPIDVPCEMPESDLLPYVERVGPVGRAMAGLGEGERGRVLDAVRSAFDPWVEAGRVRFTAACWVLDSPRRPSRASR